MRAARRCARTLGCNVRVRIFTAVAALSVAAACAPSSRQGMPDLAVNDRMISQLRALREEPKFLDLPGAPAQEERRRLEPLINALLDRLIQDLPANPKKAWVIASMQPTVKEFYLEDTEARERCVDYLKRILSTVGIQTTEGAFAKYLIFI